MYNGFKIIALCVTKISDGRRFEIVRLLNESVTKYGYRLFVYHACSDFYWKTKNEDGEKTVFDLIDYDIADALITFDECFADKSVSAKIREKALEKGIPTFVLGGEAEGCINFVFDYKTAFEKIVRHVIEEHGITDVHMITGTEGEVNSEERAEVFRKVASENGIDVTDDMISYGQYWNGPTIEVLDKLVSENRLPKAFVCVNDTTAVTVCTYLEQKGYSVPKDIIVTGFDGTEEARLNVPPISTCECDYAVMTEQIAMALNRCFEGDRSIYTEKVSYVMTADKSCGCSSKHGELNVGDLLKYTRDIFYRYQDDEKVLYEMSSNALMCASPQELSECIGSFKFYTMCVCVNHDVFDCTKDPVTTKRSRSFDEDMLLLFRADSPGEKFLYDIKHSEIVPEIDYILDQKTPLIFTALSYIGTATGFACFYFSADMNSYCKIMQYVNALNTAINGFRSVKYQQYMTSHIEEIYKFDSLTSIYNRKGFDIEFEKLARRAAENKLKMLVMSADVDGLKFINDKFGHEEGDFAICTVANAINSVVLENKACSRFGGDEIVLVAFSEKPEELCGNIRQQVTEYIEKVNGSGEKPYKVSTSLGFGTGEISDFEEVLRISDKQMYREKATKPRRNRQD